MGWVHYRDLIVWQKAMDLVDELYQLLGFCRGRRAMHLLSRCEGRSFRSRRISRKGTEDRRRKNSSSFSPLQEVLFMSWRHSCISVYANSIFPSCRPKKL